MNRSLLSELRQGRLNGVFYGPPVPLNRPMAGVRSLNVTTFHGCNEAEASLTLAGDLELAVAAGTTFELSDSEESDASWCEVLAQMEINAGGA